MHDQHFIFYCFIVFFTGSCGPLAVSQQRSMLEATLSAGQSNQEPPPDVTAPPPSNLQPPLHQKPVQLRSNIPAHEQFHLPVPPGLDTDLLTHLRRPSVSWAAAAQADPSLHNPFLSGTDPTLNTHLISFLSLNVESHEEYFRNIKFNTPKNFNVYQQLRKLKSYTFCRLISNHFEFFDNSAVMFGILIRICGKSNRSLSRISYNNVT